MLDATSLAGVALIFIVTFLVTFISTPIIGRLMKQHGRTGRDVHKLSKTEVPEMCGLAILLGLTVGAGCYSLFFPSSLSEVSAFLGTMLIAGGIGFVDDIHPLSARIKPLLTALACVPILLLGTYDPHPIVPFLGPVRLTVVYPFLVPLALAVTSNAVNMMDVMNGAMPGTTSIISIMIAGIFVASGDGKGAAVAFGLLAALLAFYYFNKFPARVFDGDTGSLAVGAALGALSILGKIEAVVIVALIPHIMNAFYGLSSVGRLYERREIPKRPIQLLDDETLEASPDREAPVTLARIILASEPLKEREVVRRMIFLTIISSILAALTYEIMLVGKI